VLASLRTKVKTVCSVGFIACFAAHKNLYLYRILKGTKPLSLKAPELHRSLKCTKDKGQTKGQESGRGRVENKKNPCGGGRVDDDMCRLI
jgi:predicted phage tail protein